MSQWNLRKKANNNLKLFESDLATKSLQLDMYPHIHIYMHKYMHRHPHMHVYKGLILILNTRTFHR